MVVDDLNALGACIDPTEANAPLIIDADAVLSQALPLQCLEAIAWRNAKIIKATSDLKLPQLTSRDDCYVNKSPDALTLRQCLRVGAPERSDHGQ